MLVQGGWQAVAAGFATFNGVGFALTFAVIGAAGQLDPISPGLLRV